MAQNQNQGYQPIDESKVNWDKIEEKFGISKEVLEKTGAKDNMLNFGKSGLLDVTMLIYDQKVKAAARLQLTRLPDGTYSVLPHFVRKEQKLENAEYMGYTFTKEDAKALKETGNLGKVVPLFNVKDNTMQECFVSLDKQTNELVHYPVSKLHLRESVGNVKFTPEEMALLKHGGIVKDKLFEGENGQKFTVDFQVNADRKNVAFVPGSSRKEEEVQEQNQKAKMNWTNEDGSIKNLTKWKGIPLTEEQQKDYREGKSETRQLSVEGRHDRHDVPDVLSRQEPAVCLEERSDAGQGRSPSQRERDTDGCKPSGQDQRGHQESGRTTSERTGGPQERASEGVTEARRREAGAKGR